MCLMIIKAVRSRYFPGVEIDEIRRHAITKISINEESGVVIYPDSLALVKTTIAVFGWTLVIFVRWVLDLLKVTTAARVSRTPGRVPEILGDIVHVRLGTRRRERGP